MKKHHILRAARKKAGMPLFRKDEIMRYICDQLQVEMPPTWTARYALMRQWAVPPKAAKPPKATVAPVQAPTAKGEAKRKKRLIQRAQSDSFLLSYEWRRLRMEVIKERGARCECCGATPRDGIVIHVDHVKPRKLRPDLALEKSNLQVLCEVCNHGKGNWDETDWREPQEPSGPRLVKPA